MKRKKFTIEQFNYFIRNEGFKEMYTTGIFQLEKGKLYIFPESWYDIIPKDFVLTPVSTCISKYIGEQPDFKFKPGRTPYDVKSGFLGYGIII